MAAELTAMEKNMRRRQRKRNLVAYSFIAPNFIGFAVFTLGPIVLALLMSFAEWDGSNAMRGETGKRLYRQRHLCQNGRPFSRDERARLV